MGRRFASSCGLRDVTETDRELDLNYEVDWNLLVVSQGTRFLFERTEEPKTEVDLFIDRLDMCHSLDLRSRLELHRQTIPLADVLLQKLQIVELTRKDVVDTVALLLDHDLGGPDPEEIDAGYISRLLSDDWGFCYTTLLNLKRMEETLDSPALEPEEKERVRDRLRRLAEAIGNSPKTRRWKLRAKIGTKKKWYEDVSEGTAAF